MTLHPTNGVRLHVLALVLSILPVAACVPDKPQTSAPAATAGVATKTVNARFACADGKTIDATFVNEAKGRVDLKLSDGRAVSLPQSVSADGARYASSGDAMVFWNIGHTAFLQEGGKRTFDSCNASR